MGIACGTRAGRYRRHASSKLRAAHEPAATAKLQRCLPGRTATGYRHHRCSCVRSRAAKAPHVGRAASSCGPNDDEPDAFASRSTLAPTKSTAGVRTAEEVRVVTKVSVPGEGRFRERLSAGGSHGSRHARGAHDETTLRRRPEAQCKLRGLGDPIGGDLAPMNEEGAKAAVMHARYEHMVKQVERSRLLLDLGAYEVAIECRATYVAQPCTRLAGLRLEQLYDRTRLETRTPAAEPREHRLLVRGVIRDELGGKPSNVRIGTSL
jgi:hypothetical protein